MRTAVSEHILIATTLRALRPTMCYHGDWILMDHSFDLITLYIDFSNRQQLVLDKILRRSNGLSSISKSQIYCRLKTG